MIMAFPFYFPFNCKHLPTIPVGVPSDLLGMLPHCCPFFPGPGTPRYVSHKAYHETSQKEKNSLHFGNFLRNCLAILASFMKVPLNSLRFSQHSFHPSLGENSPESHESQTACVASKGPGGVPCVFQLVVEPTHLKKIC